METPSSGSTDIVDDFNTKLVFFSNEFPNDDLKDLFRRLQRRSKDKRFAMLATLLENCSRVIKEESAQLPQCLRDLIPPFDDVLTLVDSGNFRFGPLGAAMESSFLVVLQLGMLIGHYESENIYDLRTTATTLAGLSTGLLAGAAVSLASSLKDLTNTAAESVRVAFRLGCYIDEMSRKIESCDPENPLSWAYVVTQLSAEQIQLELDQYNKDTSSAELTKLFISASDQVSTSVSGPPSRLKHAFMRVSKLRHSKHLPLPVFEGLCHAPHLYDEEDICRTINGSQSQISLTTPVQTPLLSASTGIPFPASDSCGLYEQISIELLTGTIYTDNQTAGIVKRLKQPGAVGCQVELFRSTLISKALLSLLETQLFPVKVKRQDLLDWSFKDIGPRQPHSHKDSKLAVVGMACRMPGGANDTELFWQLMEDKRDTHTTVPPDRFDLTTHYDPTGKTENATQTPYGSFIDRPGLFDAGFFNMSPTEAEQTDPMQRLALVTAYEALEMAGFVADRTSSTRRERVGTYYGQASDDWRELNASQNLGTYAVPGGVRAFGNGRINYFFNFWGPSINLDTACSSGAAAVNAACSALWGGEADTVIAGGLNVITDPDNYAGLCNAHFLSKTGQCKVWDKDADGYCRADGVGSVVIKRLEDAEADNDNILAVILSAATNHSAEAVSITHPHVGAQKANYTQVMQAAAIDPLDVSYIELHGTGTQAGDAIESESVADVFAPVSPRRRADQRLLLGAVKSNIGHGEAAAGISSFLKLLLMYQKNQIPPHIGIKTEINPKIPQDLAQRNVSLAYEMTPWPRIPGKKRYALLNSFGAHGGNTTMLLEDGPEKEKQGLDPRMTHVVTVSAKSKVSLAGNIKALLSYLQENPDTDLGDLAYTTCARRMHHNFRVATAVSSLDELRKFLQYLVEDAPAVRSIPLTAVPVAFAFTGQGAYYKGISAQLFRDIPYYRTQILQLDHIAQRLGFPSVVPVIEGSIEDDVCPVVAQLSIIVVEIALATFWSHLGISPVAVVGHSLGEYAALVVADVLSATDAIFLAGKRAQYIKALCEAGSHSMLSVRSSAKRIQDIAGSLSFEISCINGREDTVISGTCKEVADIRQTLEAQGLKCTPLDLPFAFHSKQMEPMLAEFRQTAKNVTFKAPNLPLISPLLSTCIFDGKTIDGNYLADASRKPVNFVGAIDAAVEMGIIDSKTYWIDIGPHPICASFVRNHITDARTVASLKKNEDNFATLAKTLASLHCDGVNIRWNDYYSPYETAHTLLNLKKYIWNQKNYWIDYIGTWTLDKAHLKYNQGKKTTNQFDLIAKSSLRTSGVHRVTFEHVEGATGQLKTLSDVMHADFLAAVEGHNMNNCGVATSSIWCDMAMTVGEYLYKRVNPKAGNIHMNLTDFQVSHATIVHKNHESNQLIALECNLDTDSGSMCLEWYHVEDGGTRAVDAFATATMLFEDAAKWRTEWDRITHLVNGRIESLNHMLANGTANKVNKNMAYTLFKNVVDYADKYRGMDYVVLHEYEAYCSVTLVTEKHGNWHTPPHWIDSVSQLSGFIMNGSDSSNTKDYFYVTPGFDTCRLIERLSPDHKYRSYVRMFPKATEANMYVGDLYILRGDIIIGMVGELKFRKVPRVLMDQFFSASDSGSSSGPRVTSNPTTHRAMPAPRPKAIVKAPVAAPKTSTESLTVAKPAAVSGTATTPAPVPAAGPLSNTVPVEDGIENNFLRLLVNETGLNPSEITDESTFVSIGVDSLMSLVLAEKFRAELALDIKSSLFLDCPTVGEFKKWLEQYC